MNHHEQLDNILDEALSAYRKAEPLAGIEDRVLQRLRLQPETRRVTWWKWAAVAACAALVLIAAWIGFDTHRMRTAPQDSAQTQRAAQTPSTAPAAARTGANQQEEITSAHVATSSKVLHAARRESNEPTGPVKVVRTHGTQQSQFPSPTPLTPEEHALLALASSNPAALLNQPDRSRDLEIAPIAIKPLEGSAAPAQENSNE